MRPARRAATGRRRLVLASLTGAAWIVIGIAAGPVQQTCDRALATDVCLETIDAAMRRGLPLVHPLLLAAHAEPGPAAQPDQFGHRATVTFEALGIPGPIAVRLFFDSGAHWGGVPDRAAPELALWTAAQAVAIAAAGIAGPWLLLRGRRTGSSPAN